MNYRREIDGLRALAVLPVIFFHAGFSLFSGGFVGVDVFFVISGYLITRLILSEMTTGDFSLRRFYARRARRILPAMFLVMAASIPFALMWMLPSHYADFSRSIMASVLFVANIFFWRESGYFAAESSEKPLLHLWSLGVEEQFYLLFPLALLMVWRLGRKPAFYSMAGAAILGFLLCEYASHYAPSANFFLLPMRAWELLVGALCAWVQVAAPPQKQHGLGMIGLGLVLISVFFYHAHMRLPSAYTLVPVIGTALILRYGTQGTAVARVLSAKPLVAIGLISYSAYLWHHPLFAFARLRNVNMPEFSTMLLLSAAALVLGGLTWWLVEQPFRQRAHPRYVSNRRAGMYGMLSAALLLGVGLYGHVTHGRLTDWTAQAGANQVRAFELLDAARQQDRFYDNGACVFNVNTLTQAVQERITACHKKYGKGIAIIGDSHAINSFHILRTHAQQRPFIVGISQGMCRPYSHKADCYYEDLVRLVQHQTDVFQDVIYQQGGFHLLADARGKNIERGDISGLPMDASVPDFMPDRARIAAVKDYLQRLAPLTRVTWLGSRIEPHIRESLVVQLGCDYPFRLRPNQAEIFMRLDETLAAALEGSPIRYRSEIRMMHFDMAHDFISCDKTYFMDGDHYSVDGEVRFSKRITLDSILKEKAQP